MMEKFACGPFLMVVGSTVVHAAVASHQLHGMTKAILLLLHAETKQFISLPLISDEY